MMKQNFIFHWKEKANNFSFRWLRLFAGFSFQTKLNVFIYFINRNVIKDMKQGCSSAKFSFWRDEPFSSSPNCWSARGYSKFQSIHLLDGHVQRIFGKGDSKLSTRFSSNARNICLCCCLSASWPKWSAISENNGIVRIFVYLVDFWFSCTTSRYNKEIHRKIRMMLSIRIERGENASRETCWRNPVFALDRNPSLSRVLLCRWAIFT